MSNDIQTASFCALAGLTGFVFGAYFQHEVALRNVLFMVKTEPFAFKNRHKLYKILSLFKCNPESRLDVHGSVPAREKLLHSLFSPLYSVCSYFIIVRSTTPSSNDNYWNLAKLAKYGLPTTDNVTIGRGYVLAHERRSDAVLWLCEHFSGNDSRSRRLQHVQLLKNGATSSSKVFGSEIWAKLTRHIAQLAERHGTIYVYTGPLYMPAYRQHEGWSLKYQVSSAWSPQPVPSHYFKVIIVDGNVPNTQGLHVEGYIVPNRAKNKNNELNHFLRSVVEIERYSGLRFIDVRHQSLSALSASLSQSQLKREQKKSTHLSLASELQFVCKQMSDKPS